MVDCVLDSIVVDTSGFCEVEPFPVIVFRRARFNRQLFKVKITSNCPTERLTDESFNDSEV
jgi:hypothetical protein